MKLSAPSIDPAEVNQQDIEKLFTRISPRYDFLNSLLSFRLDRYWRDEVVRVGLTQPVSRLLDIGTGTGKLLSAFLKKQSFHYVCGLDLCESMLNNVGLETRSQTLLTCGDCLSLPIRDESFDLVVSSFTLRSLPSLEQFFEELNRVLMAGGRIVLLELTRPRSWWLRWAYEPYLNVYLPFLGWVFSGDKNAYRFLADSIMTFKDPSELLEFIKSKGFIKSRVISLSGGLATLFVAEKP